jgi:hypothetical protein
MSAMGRKQTFAHQQFAVLQPIACACCYRRSPQRRGPPSLHLLSRPRRRRRSSDWSPAKAVTFIVTLAAHRFVTLAAAEAGMSRKSAYALKARDPVFAAAWTAALRTRKGRRQGDKVEEVEEPPVSSSQGNSLHAGLRADRRADRLFAALARSRRRPPGGQKSSLLGDK